MSFSVSATGLRIEHPEPGDVVTIRDPTGRFPGMGQDEVYRVVAASADSVVVEIVHGYHREIGKRRLLHKASTAFTEASEMWEALAAGVTSSSLFD